MLKRKCKGKSYLPGISHQTKPSTCAEDLSCLLVWDSHTAHIEIYPGKTAERTGTRNAPGRKNITIPIINYTRNARLFQVGVLFKQILVILNSG